MTIINNCEHFRNHNACMAANLLNNLGKVGLGLAIVGGVAQSALYNGKEYELLFMLISLYNIKSGERLFFKLVIQDHVLLCNYHKVSTVVLCTVI